VGELWNAESIICRIEIVVNYCGMTGKWNAVFWYSNFNNFNKNVAVYVVLLHYTPLNTGAMEIRKAVYRCFDENNI